MFPANKSITCRYFRFNQCRNNLLSSTDFPRWLVYERISFNNSQTETVSPLDNAYRNNHTGNFTSSFMKTIVTGRTQRYEKEYNVHIKQNLLRTIMFEQGLGSMFVTLIENKTDKTILK